MLGMITPLCPDWRIRQGQKPQSVHDSKPKIIWTRLGQVGHRPQRLGIMEEEQQTITQLIVGMCVVSILGNLILRC